MSFKRNYLNTDDLPCDLFKLDVTSARVNHGISKDDAYWVSQEHCHFYRTCDSDGKILTECAATVGHKHDCTVIKDKKGDIVEVKCSPAKWTNDQHVHTVTYLWSSKIKQRVWNPNIQSAMAQNENVD